MVHQGEEITVITPQSPAGQAILEKRQDDKFRFDLGGAPTDCRILRVE